MSKASRERRKLIKKLKEIPGGLAGAKLRGSNGTATLEDVDFVNRVRRELRGEDGYSGAAHLASKPLASKPSGPNYTFNTYSPKSKEDGVFVCEESKEITSTCPLNPTVPSILMDKGMWWAFLNCAKVYNTEWIALLIGKFEPTGDVGKPTYRISKFYFPPQTASGAHVDVPTGVRPKPGTIGAIHSHVDMGVFWSQTDKDHSNWPVEIVINRRESYEALTRYQLKCGEWAKSKATVYLTGSGLSQAVRTQVENAFVEGTKLARASKASSVAGVAAEDKADVAKAIVHVPYTSNPSTPNPSNPPTPTKEGVCPNIYTYGSIGDQPCIRPIHHTGLCETASRIMWYAKGYKVTDSDPTITPVENCPTPKCDKKKGHAGWHSVYNYDEGGKDFYFLVPGEEGYDNFIKSHPNWDKEKEVEQLSLAMDDGSDPTVINGEVVGVVADVPEDLEEEEYCAKCEGTSFIEDPSSPNKAIPCPDCLKHPGLSDIGAVRAIEDGWLLN